jgi:uncharacterized protein YecE (DUF72 family)
MRPVRVGCSGWQYDDWRGRLYPEGLGKARWLGRYAECFDTVEVNSTFYRLASRAAVERWVEDTPDDFVFACKASQYLTHMKRLRGLEQGLVRYYERIEPLVNSRKLGPVVWQLPERFTRDDPVLADALEKLPQGLHCFEFRHESWFCDEVYELLRKHGVALVIGDHPERPFQTYEMTADWTFVRFHYGRRGRRGNYSEREIEEWAGRIGRWRRSHAVYAYFNNDWKGFAVENALSLRRRLPGDGPEPGAEGGTRASARSRSGRRSPAA